MHNELLKIGPFTVYGYGLMIAIGIFSAYCLAEYRARKLGLEDEKKYGFVLRAKGMVPAGDGTWVYFDYVPGESNVREGKPDVTGKFCVIGSKLNEAALAELFDRK